MLERALLDWTEKQGFRVAWGPAAVLDDIRSHFISLSESGVLEPVFAGKLLGWVFPPDGFPVADRKTVILIDEAALSRNLRALIDGRAAG